MIVQYNITTVKGLKSKEKCPKILVFMNLFQGGGVIKHKCIILPIFRKDMATRSKLRLNYSYYEPFYSKLDVF